MKRLALIVLFFGSISYSNLFADVTVFFVPIIEHNGKSITIKDIARLDCSSSLREKIYNIQIHKELYRDGYIDRKEIYALIKEYINDTVFIYGNAVKISKKADLSENITTHKHDNGDSVISGNILNVIVKKNGISVEIIGKAMEYGERGDEIMLMLNGSKR